VLRLIVIPCIYLITYMLGLHNISYNVDIMKFNLRHKLVSLPSHCLSKQKIIKKYIIFPYGRNAVHLGYIPGICKLLLKYDLLYVVNNFTTTARFLSKLHGHS